MDISEFLSAKADCQISFPVRDDSINSTYPVAHYFLNGRSAVFQTSPRETVDRTLTHVFNAVISDPKKTLRDLPTEGQPARKNWAHPIGAVYDAHYNLVPESQFRNNQVLPDKTLERPEETLPGTWVFLGYYNEVYGHFILEGLCRLWALSTLKDLPVKFFYLPIRDYHEFKGRYTEPFLKAYNPEWNGPGKFTDSIKIITKPVRMEHVIVPSRSFDIQGGPRLDYLSIVNKLMPPPQILPNRKRYYLSRKTLPLAQHKFINEAEVEAIFSDFGFEAVNPHELSLKKQLRVYQKAEFLAGAISSALHNSIFSPADCHVIAMNGRWPQTGRVKAAENGQNFANPVCPQDRLCAAKGQSLSYIENHRAFHIEGMLTGRMMYFIGPKYCHELVQKIMKDPRDSGLVTGLTNGLTDTAMQIMLLESIEFAINGNAINLATTLKNWLSEHFQMTSELKKQLRRFDHRLGSKAKANTVDSGKAYTIFPDSTPEAVDYIIEQSSPLAQKTLTTLRALSPSKPAVDGA